MIFKTRKNKAFFLSGSKIRKSSKRNPHNLPGPTKPQLFAAGGHEKKKLLLSEAFVCEQRARRYVKTCKFPYFFAVKNIGNFQTKNMINFNKFWYIINILTLQHGRTHCTTFILFFMVDITAYIPYFFIIFPYVLLFFLIFILI